MSKKQYTVIDESVLVTGLAVEQGGVVLTTDAAGLDINHTARSSFAQEIDNVAVEVLLYGDAVSLAGKAAVGFGNADHSLNTYVGASSNSIGYRVFDGEIHIGGVSVASVATGTLGDVVKVISVRAAAETTLYFYLNENLQYTYVVDKGCPALPLADPLYWMISLGSVEGGDINAFVNSGAQQFEYATVLAQGFYRVPILAQTARFSDVPYVSHPSDSLPSVRWVGTLEPTDVTIDRGVTFWPWGSDESARGSTLSFTVVDAEGALDATLDGSYRDQPVTLQLVESHASFDSAEALGSFVVEDVQMLDELRRKITCVDALATYEVPMQRRYYRPDYDEQAAFRPWTIMLGAVFSAELTLIDSVNFTYALDSVGVSSVGKIRDKGSPFSTLASPPDYVIADGGQSVTLRNQPVGVITLDAEVSGVTFVNPSGNDSPSTDLLEDHGNPFRGDSGTGEIYGWDVATGMGGADPRYVDSSRVQFSQYYARNSAIWRPNVVFTAGKTYRYRITVSQVPGYVGSSGTARLLFAPGITNVPPPGAFLDVRGNYDSSTTASPFPRTYEGTFTQLANTTGVTVFYYANSVVGASEFSQRAEITEFRLEEVPVVDPEADDEVVEEALTPMSLRDIAKAMIEERGQLPSTSWNEDTFAAIDTATGYSGSGFYATEQVTVRYGLSEALRGYTAGVYRASDGRIASCRLIAPEDETATKTLGELDIESVPIFRLDKAPGLSRRFGVRRNERILTDSDLVTDDVQVTMRLRRKLGRQHRFICAYGGPLAPVYSPSDAAGPVDTHLVKKADGNAEIQRIGAIYADARGFYDIACLGRSDIEIGDVVTVTYDGFGLSSGKNLLVVRSRENKLEDKQMITFWGLAP